ncbi:MAG: hypothetical protein KC443_23460, partial [Anaerolineales bacterium]|nr:hypothetical protein [Anaerolineales bacterium]
DRDLQLVAAPDSDHDVLYLGLFNQTTEIAEILASEGISLTIEPPVLTADEEEALAAEEDAETEPADEEVIDQETIAADDIADDMDTMRLIQSGWGNVQMSGTALILLHETGAQRSVVVLAASADGLENTVNRILELIPLNADYALSDCLVQDNLALCPTNVANEVVEAELLSGGQPDDTGNQGGTSSGGGDDIGGGFMPPVDADFQGFIGLDDSVSGSLGENEAHSWVFRDGPATIDIVMESDDLDGVLELYNPDGDYITSADSGLSGDSEAIEGITIEDDGEYTIVVRDFWGEVGDYTLSVTEAAAAPETGDNGGGGNRVFILADDDGEALNGGFTSVDFFASQLSADYDVTVWVTSVDGRLEFDTLDGVDLLIWDTGDYQDPEGFLDEDTTVIFNYLDAGEGDILMVGSAPVLFSYLDATPLSDLEVAGGDPILLNGLQVGDIIDLDQTYATISPDVVEGDIGEEDTLFLLRGPASEDAGAAVAVASSDVNEDGQKLALLAFPFTALPEDIQDILLANLLDWFAQN